MANTGKTFRLQDEQGNTVAGIDGVPLENVYIGGGYGALLPGQKAPGDLEVDEFCKKSYSLSGQKPTTYVIVRTA